MARSGAGDRSEDMALDDRYRYLSLITYRANGAEVATPVWFASVDGTLYVFTAGDSGTPPHASSPTRQ